MYNLIRVYQMPGLLVILLTFSSFFLPSAYSVNYREPVDRFSVGYASIGGGLDSHILSNDLSKQKVNDDLYFVMERVTKHNIKFWDKFKTKQFILASALKQRLPNNGYAKNIAGGMAGFSQGLKMFNENNTELWIAYATPNLHAVGKEKLFNIDVCMTVTTSPNIPIVTNMGIVRTPTNFYIHRMNKKQKKSFNRAEKGPAAQVIKDVKAFARSAKKARSILMPLHAFAARFMLCEGKDLMITSLLPKMKEIFIDEVGLKNVCDHLYLEDKQITYKYRSCDSLNIIKMGYLSSDTDAPNSEKVLWASQEDLSKDKYPWLHKLGFLYFGNPENIVAIKLKELAKLE